MASQLLEILRNVPRVMSELTDEDGAAWHIVKDKARDFVYEQDRTLTYAEAWEIVHKASEYDVPDLEELGISTGSVLDALVKAAERADEAKDLTDTEAEIDKLEELLDDLPDDGLYPYHIEIDQTSLGFLPHAWERDKYGGVLYHWNDVEGSGPADVLRWEVEGGVVWLRLAKAETEDDSDDD